MMGSFKPLKKIKSDGKIVSYEKLKVGDTKVVVVGVKFKGKISYSK
ncbi:hypothetical protein [Fictibacillus barbaricus]|uniref:Uncharacterized protein n=1 Tax=Fictibacillus barbaricus TaxID=182136 RepID=A0ABU1U5I0_9BACL|nr:hypothetical protein [Fictibacillus barbaricus]MDR7074730.1 hypothetical protein [Fictibacillus barbaricus]